MGSAVSFKNKESKLYGRKAKVLKANSSGSYEVKLIKPLPSGVGILTVTGRELDLVTEITAPLKGKISDYIKNLKSLSSSTQSLLNSAEQIGASNNQVDFADRSGKLIATATIKDTLGSGNKSPMFNHFDMVTIGNVYKSVNGKSVKIESTPNFQFGIAVAREDASEAKEAFSRSNIDPNTIFSDGPLTIFGFNTSENSTGEKRYNMEDLVKILDLEGIAHMAVDGKEFKATPVTLDLDDKDSDNRMED